MKDRIKKIMDKEGFNPATFADYLGINRQTMNATLGRNKTASINIVIAILEKYKDINPDWLLFGKGPMYKGEKTILQPDLFENTEIIEDKDAIVPKYAPKNIDNKSLKEEQPIEKKEINYQKTIEKKIDKIMIFFTDNTFETLVPEKKN